MDDNLLWILWLLCLLPILLIIFGELSMTLHTRYISKKFKMSYHVPCALTKFLSITGSLASSVRSILWTEGEEIFNMRTLFANKYGGLYIAHGWSLRVCFAGSDPSIKRFFIIIADAELAAYMLSSTDEWIKKQNYKSDILQELGKFACTSQNGEDSVRHRSILINAMKRCKPCNRAHVIDISSTFLRKIQYIISSTEKTTNPNHVVDMLPHINEMSLSLMLRIIFGPSTSQTSLETFSHLFLQHWDLVRSSSSITSIKGKRKQRDRSLAVLVSNLKLTYKDLIYDHRRRHCETIDNFECTCIMDTLVQKTLFPDPAVVLVAQTLPPPLSHVDPNIVVPHVLPVFKYVPTSSSSSTPESFTFSLEELVHNLHNLITASFETIAHTFAMSLWHTSTLPDFQVHMAKINTVNSNTSSDRGNCVSILDSSPNDLRKAVIQEALRLHPPVIQIARYCPSAVEVKSLMRCPAGTSIIIDIVGMHRRRVVWGEAAAIFDVEKWLTIRSSDEESQRVTMKSHWMPFGKGLKSCLGQALAISIVSDLLQSFSEKYSWRQTTGFVLDFIQTPTLRLRGGLRLELTARQTGRAAL